MKCLVFVYLVCYLAYFGCVAQEYDVPVDEKTQVFFGANGPKASASSIILDRSDLIVNSGDEINLECGVDGDYRYCFWESANSNIFQVEDVYAGMISGMTAPARSTNNQCGIRIKQAKNEDHGMWTCKVFIIGNTLVGKKNVIVTIQPDAPVMNVVNPLQINEGDTLPITCSVASARPQVEFFWQLGNKKITINSAAENMEIDNKGTYRSLSTLTHAFHADDDMKLLRCGISHITLKEPSFSEVSLDIKFKPVEAKPYHIYGIKVDGKGYKMIYNFSSNPRPTEVSWIIGHKDTIPVPGQMGRYTSDIIELVGNKHMAALDIESFTEDDVNKEYSLVAKNQLGETSYKIMLSTAEPPTNLLGGGAIAAIIIVIVLVIITLCIAGFMRYRQMYCFESRIKNHIEEGGGDVQREEHSDTESARESHAAQKSKNPFKNFRGLIKTKKESVEKEDEEGKAPPKDETELMLTSPDIPSLEGSLRRVRSESRRGSESDE